MDFAGTARVQMFSALAGGAVLLAVPSLLLGPFGLTPTPHVEIVARMLGGVLFALGATLAGVGGVTDRPTQIRVCVGNAVCDGSIALFLGVATWGGVLSIYGWGLMGIFAVNCVSWLVALRAGATAAAAIP